MFSFNKDNYIIELINNYKVVCVLSSFNEYE